MELFGLDMLEIAIRLLLGLLIGFCIGLTGIGGGVLVLPTLTMLFRMNAVMAVGTASFYAFLTKVSATFHHARLKNVDWSLASFFLVGAVPVNLLVARWVSGRGEDLEFARDLQRFIAGVVCFCVAVMALNLISQIWKTKISKTRGKTAECVFGHPLLRQGLGIAVGGLIGGLMAATSIGGGVLMIPLLMVVFGLDAKRTVGTSIFIAVVLSMLTSLNYLVGSDSICLSTSVVMAVGSLIGVPLGSRLSVRLPERALHGVVLAVIFVVAVVMLSSGGSGH